MLNRTCIGEHDLNTTVIHMKTNCDELALNIVFFVWCPQSSKVLAKHELLKVPLIGWTWYFLEIVFCKRRWEEDRDTVFRGLAQLKDYPEFMWVGTWKFRKKKEPWVLFTLFKWS